MKLKKTTMQQHKREIRIMVSGGGTGGHIFPAIAIADALKSRIPGAKFLFVGAEGRMEMEKVPAAGYEIEALKIAGLQRRLTLKNLSFPFKLLGSMLKARKLVKQFKPDVVIGVGGYASGPILRVASKQNIPTLIQEQNSYPGITNKILAKSVDRICVAYDKMDRFFPKEKIYLTGNPVRDKVIAMEASREEALAFFELKAEKPCILVVGGSLGARSINRGVKNSLQKVAEKDVQVIWQTGKHFIEEARAAVKALGSANIYVTDFISRMDMAYPAADLVVSRAGAIAISEIQAVSKPVILVPSPNVAEDHQTKNAMALVTYNAAVLVKDQDAPEILGDEMLRLVNDEKELLVLNDNISKLARKDAANTIAGVVIDMIE
jgi:UDP-N-acetylglucosamine--N-acetylmuramyl-(pentapeptide) pyrophosphoryl-undecaprenol N-acetylglucosamine transferase